MLLYHTVVTGYNSVHQINLTCILNISKTTILGKSYYIFVNSRYIKENRRYVFTIFRKKKQLRFYELFVFKNIRLNEKSI